MPINEEDRKRLDAQFQKKSGIPLEGLFKMNPELKEMDIKNLESVVGAFPTGKPEKTQQYFAAVDSLSVGAHGTIRSQIPGLELGFNHRIIKKGELAKHISEYGTTPERSKPKIKILKKLQDLVKEKRRKLKRKIKLPLRRKSRRSGKGIF